MTQTDNVFRWSPCTFLLVASSSDCWMHFESGDHLRVRRPVGPLGYQHHGIYISDERVIQFGGAIRDKRRATIQAVSLEDFETGGSAEVVQHGGRTWWGSPRFGALPKDQTVQRAEWLLANHRDGLYDLFGYNCEQAATFCSTGAYESYQVRGFFFVNLLTGFPLMLWIAKRSRTGRPFSRKTIVALYALYTARLVPHILYYARGERFTRHIGRKWIAHEQQQRSEGR